MSVPGGTTVVVPCYDEAARFQAAGFRELAEHPDVVLVFVDDGSTDDTGHVLGRAAARWPGKAQVLALPTNGGKAEAVRRGLLHALEGGAARVGYLDADLATPAAEMLRLRAILVERDATAVIGARVALLGRDIRRSAARHYIGRVFATAASAVLGLRVYDTQCGAKLFRASPELRRALSAPFHSRWAFDVELLGRIVAEQGSADGILEVPLRVWHDIHGSKVSVPDMARAAVEIARIGVELARWRRRAVNDARRPRSR
jgi:dolichyl-phosphate beta-glucosyltransferase